MKLGLKYILEIDINAPRAMVVDLFDDPQQASQWQPTLRSYTLIDGARGQAGRKIQLIYQFGRGTLEMLETVEVSNLPSEFTVTYEAHGVWNRVVNRFVEIDPHRTRWLFESEFKCRGMMRLASIFQPGMFKKASQKDMARFRDFAEKRFASAEIRPS